VSTPVEGRESGNPATLAGADLDISLPELQWRLLCLCQWPSRLPQELIRRRRREGYGLAPWAPSHRVGRHSRSQSPVNISLFFSGGQTGRKLRLNRVDLLGQKQVSPFWNDGPLKCFLWLDTCRLDSLAPIFADATGYALLADWDTVLSGIRYGGRSCPHLLHFEVVEDSVDSVITLG
jgi:hypothetical protein